MNIKKLKDSRRRTDSTSNLTYRIIGTTPNIKIMVFDSQGDYLDGWTASTEEEANLWLEDNYPEAVLEQ